MPERPAFQPNARGQHQGLSDAHEHIGKVDEILTELPDDLAGRRKTARQLLRTIGRFLDEASMPSIHRNQVYSDDRTNRELRAVLNALDIPADRRAFDISTEVQALVTSRDFKTNDLARERLRHLRRQL